MNKFKVAILTQNGINNNKGNKLEDIVETEPDIYVEFTQEDKRYFKNNPIIENEFIENYTQIAENQSARPTTFTFGYNIVSKIFLKNSIFNQDNINEINTEYFVIYMDREGNILQHIPATSTKAAVCIKLNINNIQLLFINLHLPMLKKKEGLGVAERTKALKDLIEYLQYKYIVDADTNLIIGGDLNFRMDEHGNDQLTDLIKNREIKEMNDDQNMFTCKFTNKLNNKNNNYDDLKQCRESDFTKGNFTEIQSEVQDSCGVHNRLPSKCDRFLIVEGYGTSIIPIEYKAIYLENLKSDHNAVYSIFTIENNQSPRQKVTHPKVTHPKVTHPKVTRPKVTRSKKSKKKGGLKNKKYTRRKYVK